MSILLYRFTDATAFPILETETAGGLACAQVVGPAGLPLGQGAGVGNEAYLSLELTREGSGASEARVVLALPPRAIVGCPEMLELTVLGDGGGVEIFLEAGDTNGWGFAYAFGPVDFHGWRTLEVSVQAPAERWGTHERVNAQPITPPLQFSRLGFNLALSSGAAAIGVRALHVTGDIRMAPPGIACG